MPAIEAVGAREILDSRGNPTVEVEVALDDGTLARAAVPERREHRRSTRPSSCATAATATAARASARPSTRCSTPSARSCVGFEATEQRLVDQALIDLDGTPDKGRYGANALLGICLAVARAAADSLGLPLFRYVGGPNAHLLPVPMLNILNGGAHADTNVDVQEFMIAPIGAATFAEAPADGRGGLPRAQDRAQGPRAHHQRRRRGRLRARPAGQPRRARPHPRGDHRDRADPRPRHRARPRRRRDASSTAPPATASRAATRPPSR